MRKAKPSIQAILLTCTAAGALSLGLAGTAYAQDTGEEQVAEDTPQGIVVTGSRIRGIDPVGSNVIALDQERIEEADRLTADIHARLADAVKRPSSPSPIDQ